MVQKGSAPINFLLVIAILGTAGYFAYTKGYFGTKLPKSPPTSTPITSPLSSQSVILKTYSNDKYLFSLSYPSNLKIISKQSDNSLQWGKLLFYTSISNNDYQLLRVNIYRMDKDNLLDWVIHHSKENTPDFLYYYAINNIRESTLNSYPSLEFRYHGDGTQGETKTTLLNLGDYVYSISQESYYYLKTIDPETNALTDKILNTFKFTQ